MYYNGKNTDGSVVHLEELKGLFHVTSFQLLNGLLKRRYPGPRGLISVKQRKNLLF